MKMHTYIYKKKRRERERETGHMMTYGNENTCKWQKRKTYLHLGLIKKYGAGSRSILLVLRLQKKKKKNGGGDKMKEISKHVYGVSRRKPL